MDCDKIEKTEETKNHLEALTPVCATSIRRAERASREAARTKFGEVLAAAKIDLAAELKCDLGECRGQGANCVNPTHADVLVDGESLDVEAKQANPQPQPDPCEANESQYEVTAVIGFTLKAICKCVTPPAGGGGGGGGAGNRKTRIGRFELYKDRGGKYRFRLKAANGEIILVSQAYKSRASAVNGINSVVSNSQDDLRYERKESKGKFMFNVKASNGQVVGTSEQYETKRARENGIRSVCRNAANAKSVDLS